MSWKGVTEGASVRRWASAAWLAAMALAVAPRAASGQEAAAVDSDAPAAKPGAPVAVLPPVAARVHSEGVEVLHSTQPFRGSSLGYGFTGGAATFSFRPRWYVSDQLSLRFRLDLAKQLTNADDTTYYREVVSSPALIDLVYLPAFTETWTGLSVAPNIRVTLPIDKASHAETLRLGLGPGFELYRTFDVLSGLVVSYGFRFTKKLHQYTTAQTDSVYPFSSSSGSVATMAIPDYADQANPSGLAVGWTGGVRNVSMRFANVLQARLAIVPKLYFTAYASIRNDLLYDMTPTSLPVTPTASTTNQRASYWYLLDLTFDPVRSLSLSLGTSTLVPSIDPSGIAYFPFFNRATNVYLNLTAHLDVLYEALERI